MPPITDWVDLTVRPWDADLTVREDDMLYAMTYNWYVDSVNGDDLYPGRGFTAPFKTIAKLMTVMGVNDKVGLAKGSTWREQLTVAANNIEIYAYGTGARPILDCADVIANALFTKTVGQTNVYQATASPDIAVANTWVRAWEGGTKLLRATSVINCDATPGSYYPSADVGAAPITLYVHASDSSDVITNAKVYEFNHRQVGIYALGYTGLKVDGIHTKRNLHESGSLMCGEQSYLYDCLCQDGSKHNLYYGDGSTLIDVIARDAYYNASLSYFVGYQTTAGGLGLTHSGCRAENTTGILDTNATAFYFHDSTGGSFGAVTYDDCYCIDMLAGIDTGTIYDTLTITDFEAVNVEAPIAAWKTITISGLTCNVLTNKRAVIVYAAGVTVNLSDSKITLSGAFASGALIYSPQANITINLDDVHFVGQNNEIAIALYGAGAVINAQNCDYELISRVYEIDTGAITSDYNRFRDPMTFYLNGTTYNTIALWQAGTGQDAHSTTG